MNSLISRNRIQGLFVPLFLFMLGLPALASHSEPAFAEGDPARSAVGTDLVVAKGEKVAGHVSVTKGNLFVKGEVLGDAIVVFGSADIEGRVAGDVHVVGGDVTLRSTSLVEGKLDYAGGKLIREPGAKVLGAINVVDLPLVENNATGPATRLSESSIHGWRTPFERIGSLFVWGLLSVVVLTLSVVLVLVTPRRVRVAAATLEAVGRPSVTLGIITAGLLGPLMGALGMLLMITVVGWVLIPVMVAGVAVMLTSGLAIVGVWLGRRIYQTTHQEPLQKPTPMLVQMLLGVAAILCSTVLPAALVPVGWVAGTLLGLLYVAACIGLGSILLSRMGTLPPARRQHRYPVSPGSHGPSNTMPLGSLPPNGGEK
jgi:hypothetical protein